MTQTELHPRARLPRGFRCAAVNCGIKAEGKDLALFVSDQPGAAAGLFTRSLVPGAPIVVGRELIGSGRLQAIVVNSRISNVGTGEAGIANARLNSLREFWDHPQLGARDRWTEVGTEAGAVRAPKPPFNLSEFEPRMDDVPALGAHSHAILAELGYGEAEVGRLAAEGAISSS